MSETAFLDGHAPPADNLPAKVGRPGLYNDEIAGKICDAIASGLKMKEVAKLPGFPGGSTVFRWLAQNEDFRAAYNAALEWRIESDADWMMELATDKSGDFEKIEDGKEVQSKTAIARSTLACDSLKWLMARRMPKKYGDPETIVIQAPPAAQIGAPGDNARVLNPVRLIEQFPVHSQIEATDRAIAASRQEPR